MLSTLEYTLFFGLWLCIFLSMLVPVIHFCVVHRTKPVDVTPDAIEEEKKKE